MLMLAIIYAAGGGLEIIMDNFNFYSPTEFVFGKGRENECGKYVKKYGGTKVLIHYGSGSAVRALRQASVITGIFGTFMVRISRLKEQFRLEQCLR